MNERAMLSCDEFLDLAASHCGVDWKKHIDIDPRSRREMVDGGGAVRAFEGGRRNRVDLRRGRRCGYGSSICYFYYTGCTEFRLLAAGRWRRHGLFQTCIRHSNHYPFSNRVCSQVYTYRDTLYFTYTSL